MWRSSKSKTQIARSWLYFTSSRTNRDRLSHACFYAYSLSSVDWLSICQCSNCQCLSFNVLWSDSNWIIFSINVYLLGRFLKNYLFPMIWCCSALDMYLVYDLSIYCRRCNLPPPRLFLSDDIMQQVYAADIQSLRVQ